MDISVEKGKEFVVDGERIHANNMKIRDNGMLEFFRVEEESLGTVSKIMVAQVRKWNRWQIVKELRIAETSDERPRKETVDASNLANSEQAPEKPKTPVLKKTAKPDMQDALGEVDMISETKTFTDAKILNAIRKVLRSPASRDWEGKQLRISEILMEAGLITYKRQATPFVSKHRSTVELVKKAGFIRKQVEKGKYPKYVYIIEVK